VLRPPAAFGIVERNVYRSGLVEEASFSFVQQLNLSSALVLCVEAPSKLLREFFDDSGVKVAHLGLAKWRARPSWRPVNEELVKEALEFVLDPRNHPVLIMCT
jgi:protein tyrosine/serine phosphatase